MMRNAVSEIPAVTCLAGIVLLMVYRLDAARLAELRIAAAARQDSQAAPARGAVADPAATT
jgi:Na+/melibiose symporter-like transporter